jgi:hypothetical protein
MTTRMRMLVRGQGVVWVTPRNEEEASDIGSYWNAVRKYVYSGDDSALSQFEGLSAGSYESETDPDDIDFWALRGELKFEDIYERG